MGWWFLCLVILLPSACRREESSARVDRGAEVEVATLSSRAPSTALQQTSESCRECHAEIFDAWSGTDHARANQPIEEAEIAAAFSPSREVTGAGSSFRAGVREDGPYLTALDESGADHRVVAVLGYRPTQQMLVETAGGRLQPVDMAWHPASGEWFNVFGEESRHPGEWGHWTGRGMNWNSMCAHCHMTGYQKNYDEPTDTFRSAWVEHGVGCIQCHGALPPDHGESDRGGGGEWVRDRVLAQETCAYCHARNESLTKEFIPGESYDDHFRLTLPSTPGAFWPDGQQRDEVFNWASVRLSRMGHAGVTCMDCHDPHTAKTVLPMENNALCMQCHSAPGRSMAATGLAAPVIDPAAHSRHPAGSTGNQCTACHMPETNYLQRSPRHDHGWLKPDPLLTRELGIPNACNRCHEEETVDWAIDHAATWYGDRLNSRQRQRARAVASAQDGDPNATSALLGLLADEDIPAWRATYLQLLSGYSHVPEVVTVARAELEHPNAMVRAAALQVVGETEARSVTLLNDVSRLVRLEAARWWHGDGGSQSNFAREFENYLSLTLDQPAGRLRLAQYQARRGDLAGAEQQVRQAAAWDRLSPAIHEFHAEILRAAGRSADAANAYYLAARLSRDDGEAMFRAGLAYAEAGLRAESQTALTAAVRRDPSLHRAWYNLGLLQSQQGQPDAALESLANAEVAGPEEADYPYAVATIHWQRGDREAAYAAAQRCLAIDPGHELARRLLQR